MRRSKRSKQQRVRKAVSLAELRFKQLAKMAGAAVKAGRPPKKSSASRMVSFAKRLEQTMVANNALPARRGDLTLIGDLADLEWRTAVLWQAICDFAKSGQRNGEFDARLMMLHSSVDSVGDVIRDLRRPLARLLRTRCGVEGLALSALAAASSTVQGLKKPKR